MSPHTFRHTFARGWLENGGEIFKLSRVLGHSEMQTTQIYLRDFQSREARADHAQFSPVEQLRLGRGKTDKNGKRGKGGDRKSSLLTRRSKRWGGSCAQGKRKQWTL